MTLQQTIDKQIKELKKLGVTIYKGELSHAIHGDLYDPEKLESFFSQSLTLIAEETAKALELEKKEINILSDESVPAILYGRISKQEIRREKLGFNQAVEVQKSKATHWLKGGK